MDAKAILEMVRKEVMTALTKTYDKVEEFSKHQRLKLKVSALKGDIKDVKAHIGDYVYQHRQEFMQFPVIEQNITRIEELYKNIDELDKEIEALKEEEKEEEKEKEETTEEEKD